jgi:hypothetical protein
MAVWRSTKQPPATPTWSALLREAGKLVIAIALVVAFLDFFRRGGDLTETHPRHSDFVDERTLAPEQVSLCGLPSEDGKPIEIEMVYSDDMRAWIDDAATDFLHRCPNLQVKVTPLPDIAAADQLAADKLHPVVWAPSDDMAVRYLDHRWRQRGVAPPFDAHAGVSLAESPLVILLWQDRDRLLKALFDGERSPEGEWMRAMCALVPRAPKLDGVAPKDMVPGTWHDWYKAMTAPVAGDAQGDEPVPTLAEATSWGHVKLAHAKPTHDSAGSAALYLMAYDYILPPQARQAIIHDKRGQVGGKDAITAALASEFAKALPEKTAELGTWLRRCEAGLDAPPATTPDLTTALSDVGPSLYDGVVTYEHLALPLLARIDEHPDALRKLVVHYPEPTLVAHHPMIFFHASPAQTDAAQKWLKFLLSEPMQQKAIEAGFRPVSPSVTLRGYNVESNLFLRLRRYGVFVQPRLTEAPRPEANEIRELINLWGEATGRN